MPANEPVKNTPVFFVGGDTPRRRGRPKAETPLEQRVTIRLTTPEYDRLIGLSMKHGEPVTSIVRSLLKLRVLT